MPSARVIRVLEIYKTVFKQLSKKAYSRAINIGAEAEFVDFEKIYTRDDGICHICGNTINGGPGQRGDVLQFDHVKPLENGGPHKQDNIKCAHAYCNLVKGAKE